MLHTLSTVCAFACKNNLKKVFHFVSFCFVLFHPEPGASERTGRAASPDNKVCLLQRRFMPPSVLLTLCLCDSALKIIRSPRLQLLTTHDSYLTPNSVSRTPNVDILR